MILSSPATRRIAAPSRTTITDDSSCLTLAFYVNRIFKDQGREHRPFPKLDALQL